MEKKIMVVRKLFTSDFGDPECETDIAAKVVSIDPGNWEDGVWAELARFIPDDEKKLVEHQQSGETAHSTKLFRATWDLDGYPSYAKYGYEAELFPFN